jgi:hypothetical protein
MGEIPEQPKYEQPIVMIAQTKLDPSAESLFNRTFASPAKPEGNPVISTGQIQAMTVPDGWVKRDAVNLPSGGGLVEYHPPGHDDIRLNSYYRGSRVGQEAAQAFKDCLAKPPHQLQSKELKDLAQVLGDKSYDFDIFFAKTADLNGKRVLSVEGRYKDKDHTSSQTIYVDSDGTGSAVQEISYTASGKDYQDHLSEAQKALKSIIWK